MPLVPMKKLQRVMSGTLDFSKRGQYCRLNISVQLGDDNW